MSDHLSYKKMSRGNWGFPGGESSASTSGETQSSISAGALQRIADSLEILSIHASNLDKEVENQNEFMRANAAGYRLGLTAAWLNRQAEAGKIPSLVVGKSRRFNVAAVRAKMLEISK